MSDDQHLVEAYKLVLDVYTSQYLVHNTQTTKSLRSTAADLGVRQSLNGLDFTQVCPSCSKVYDVSKCGECSKRLEACLCAKPKLSAIPFHLHWHCRACCCDKVGPYMVNVPGGAARVLGMTDIPEVLLALRVALADMATRYEDTFEHGLQTCASDIGSVWNYYKQHGDRVGVSPEQLGMTGAVKTLLFYSSLADTDVVLRAFHVHQSQPLQKQHLLTVIQALDFGPRAEPSEVVKAMTRALEVVCRTSSLSSTEKVKQAMLLASTCDQRVAFVLAIFFKALYVPYNMLVQVHTAVKNIQSRTMVITYAKRYERVLKIVDTMFFCLAMLWTPGSFTANAFSVAGFETMFRLLVQQKEAIKKDVTAPGTTRAPVVDMNPESFMKAVMTAITTGYRPADYPYQWMRLLDLGPALESIKNILLCIFRRCTLEKTSTKLVCSSHLSSLVPYLKQLGRGSLQPGSKTYTNMQHELARARQLPTTAYFFLKFFNPKVPSKISRSLADKFDSELSLFFQVDTSVQENLDFLKSIARKPRRVPKPQTRQTSLPSGAGSLFGDPDDQTSDDQASDDQSRKPRKRKPRHARQPSKPDRAKNKKRQNTKHNTKRVKTTTPVSVQVQFGVSQPGILDETPGAYLDEIPDTYLDILDPVQYCDPELDTLLGVQDVQDGQQDGRALGKDDDEDDDDDDYFDESQFDNDTELGLFKRC